MIIPHFTEKGKHLIFYEANEWGLQEIRSHRDLIIIFTADGQFAIVSSAAGKAGVPFSGSYTGSKHAINVRGSYTKIIQFIRFDISFQRLINLERYILITGIFQFSKVGKSWNRNEDYNLVSRSCILRSFEKCKYRKSRRGILHDFYPPLIYDSYNKARN